MKSRRYSWVSIREEGVQSGSCIRRFVAISGCFVSLFEFAESRLSRNNVNRGLHSYKNLLSISDVGPCLVPDQNRVAATFLPQTALAASRKRRQGIVLSQWWTRAPKQGWNGSRRCVETKSVMGRTRVSRWQNDNNQRRSFAKNTRTCRSWLPVIIMWRFCVTFPRLFWRY